MNNSQRLTRNLFQFALAVALITPALAWSHGAVDIPISRQVYCYTRPDVWQAPNTISDLGCRAAQVKSGVYPMQQWHEIAKNILPPDYNDDAKVRAAIPDGQLCGAGDPKKDGLNLASPNWHKTTVTPKDGTIDVRINATAPHVPSFVKIYLSKAGYNPATTPLKWSDLELIHEEQNTVARTDWGNDPPKPWGTAFFAYKAHVPSGRSGNAVLFVRWQRIDPAGEGFYNCSDIVINGTGSPFPWHEKGAYLPPDIAPVAGETVRFRVLGHTADAREVVDERLPITASNQLPGIWGKQLLERLAQYASIVQVGKRVENSIVFDPEDMNNNQIFLANELDTPAMSIIGGGETPTPVDPRPPQALIQGQSTVTSGQTFTLSGKGSVGYNQALVYQWSTTMPGNTNNDTLQVVAPVVTQPTSQIVKLQVNDMQNQTSSSAQITVTINPADTGQYPAYVKGVTYQGGTIVSNKGKNYQCKLGAESGWCGQAPQYYEPGVGFNWRDAWDEK